MGGMYICIDMSVSERVHTPNGHGSLSEPRKVILEECTIDFYIKIRS